MTNFLPIFPLGIVVFPTEVVNLHIFEPRYKQLITESILYKKPFAIPVVIDGKMQEVATLLEVQSLQKEYPTGEMDISCIGLHPITILEVIQDIPDKLYKGAIVNHLPYPNFNHRISQKDVIAAVRKLHDYLEVTKVYKKADEELTSFDIAHHIGLSLEQEYQVLCYDTESVRLAFILKHLKEVMLTLDQQRAAKDRILLNGHFRNLSLDNFEFTNYKK
jgi:uncharacterized protein